MTKDMFMKCFALFVIVAGALYALGELLSVPWLQFRLLSNISEKGLFLSFGSFIPICIALLGVALYEKWWNK